MKTFVKKLIALTIIVSSMIACQESTTEDIETIEAQETLNQEEVLSMAKTMVITYPVNAITNTSTTTTIHNDFDMEEYAVATSRPKITFPFEITIDGEVITVNDAIQLKELIKRNKDHEKPELVYPISVELEDNTTQEIADKEALRAYLDSLDEGVKPVFVVPLSVFVNGATIQVSDEDELKALIGKPAKGRRPHLVFPLSIILEDESTQEVTDTEEFKAYLDTLEDGIKPEFVFPISIEKNGETIEVTTQEAFDALVKKPKRGKRPEFVFPISVTLDGGATQEIADLEALKAYHETLADGIRPVYVFPVSIVKDGVTIAINSQEELDVLCGK
jgi:uncharacterized protein YktB (UPF0637 family)